MTAQIGEKLTYEGRELSMCTNPLGDYFTLGGVNPGFESNCTALWRGYVGSWEIVDGRLYLVGLSGTLESGDEASVATIFPGFADRAFAHWYSGTIRIPEENCSSTFTWVMPAPTSATCAWRSNSAS